MKWLRERDLFVALFGSSVLVAVAQFVGVFHV